MSKIEPTGSVTGKISATPNPLYFGQGHVLISWETNSPSGAEIRVATRPGDEKLVTKSKNRSGQAKISWIVGSTAYEFRLYASGQPDAPIDSVTVHRSIDSVSLALWEIADEARRGNVDMTELTHFIAAIIPAYWQTGKFSQVVSVLLHQLAIEIMRGKVSETELCQFIGTAIPKHLGNEITGNIVATPNPAPVGEDVFISWGTNDPEGGEVRFVTPDGDEELVSRQPCGRTKIPWIGGPMLHEFRLYAAGQRNTPVGSVKIRRDFGHAPTIMREIANEVTRGTIDMVDFANILATLIPSCLKSAAFPDLFRDWEKHGFHVTPVHFYQPIPDTQNLPKTLWDTPSDLVGINMNEPMQLNLLREHFPKFRNEYGQFSAERTSTQHQFHLNNGLFDGLDALVAYSIIRHFQPRLIIEIGSGYSSLLLGEALVKNGQSALICVDPFPREFLKSRAPGLRGLIEKKVEEIELEFFSQLNAGDVLFIDSSHTVKIGGDVNYLFLEVLPRLKPGVIVHIHDIFLPFEYRRDWVVDEFRFWSEQYLLQAFLTFNSEFEVLMANSYMAYKHLEDLKAAFPSLDQLKDLFPNSIGWGGGSFWMRRKPCDARQVQ